MLLARSRAKQPPGPSGRRPLGVLPDVRRDPLRLVLELHEQYGDVVRFRMGHRSLLLVSHPDLIRHVLKDNHLNYRKGLGLEEARRWLGNGLATSDGDEWQRQRLTMGPAFRRAKMLDFLPIMSSATAQMLDRWSSVARSNGVVDVASDVMDLTLAIIARSMFGSRVDHADDVTSAFSTTLQEAMARVTSFMAPPTWLPTPGNRRFRAAHALLDRSVDTLIDEYEAGTTDSLLLSVIGDAHPEGIGRRELRDQVMTILLAGHETTALAIAWTLHLLGSERDVEAAVQAETAAVSNIEDAVTNSFRGLSLTRSAFEEALRLYPPLWMLTRRANEPDELGAWPVNANSDILISPYVVHRQPDYWESPDIFQPDRFLQDQATLRTQFTYIPFGVGPRSCIGSTFALMEACLIIGSIQRRFSLRPEPGHPVVPEALLTLRFKHGLVMKPVAL